MRRPGAGSVTAWRLGRRGLLGGLVGLLAACAGLPAGGPTGAAAAGLRPSWPAAPSGAPLRRADGQALVVAVAPIADGRPDQPGRRLGTAGAAVFGLHGRELLLANDGTAVVEAALLEHLRAQGFGVVTTPQPADLRLDVTLQALSLQVAGRDTRQVAVQASLRRQAGGQLLWTGVLEDHDDRFAGVSGNDRADLEAYLGAGVAKVAARLALTLRQQLTLPAAAAPPQVSLPAAPPAAAAPTPVGATPALGYVAITTVPARARVYVDDVYHGLTPMTLELPAGVSQLHLKLDGWRDASEKVAVRRGATVELELKLQR